MNLALLFVGLRPWSAASSTAVFTRLFVAVSLFSIEAQLATLAGFSIWSLFYVNVALAAALLAFWRPASARAGASLPVFGAVPAPAVALLAVLVVTINLARPLEAADPYHLDKVDRIDRSGTLRYDPAAERKINVLNPTYELLLADARHIPVVGPWVVQLHGVLGLALLLLAVAATREHLNQAATGDAPPDTNHTGRTGPRGLWPWVVLLVVPVAFHQLVLVKNDLFVGALTLVLSAWALTRVTRATWGEVLWAAWLAGLAVAVKLTSLPIAMVVAGATLLRRQGRWHAMTAVVLGGLIGAFAGGLVFGLAENVRVYGAPMPVEDIGGGTGSLTDVVVGFPRFALSLVDLGLFTRRWWPGRGGWGGTFGLPLVWALLVLLTRRDLPLVRRAAVIAGVQFLVFPIAFLDSDLAQRLVLGPGLLLIVVGIHVLDEPPAARALRLALWPVGLLSCAQIARSALLYLRT